MTAFKPLTDYALIGNLETCALVGRDGAVDWLCLPRLDAPSVFAALLDHERGGTFRVAPRAAHHALPAYHEDSNVLDTTFSTATGEATVTDFMPIRDAPQVPRALARRVRVTRGSVPFEAVFAPRPDYARAQLELSARPHGVLARGGGMTLDLRAGVSLSVHGGEARAEWRQRAGEEVWFVLCCGPAPDWTWADWELEARRTGEAWRAWLHERPESPALRGTPWTRAVQRSGLVLKLLCCDPNGGIAAAPTTSLPEKIGGVRNWDYRYAWIRDSSFTVQALYNLGFQAEARRHLDWFRAVCKSTPDLANLQIMYALDGAAAPPEQRLTNLRGYRGSAPVRIGNGAREQRQLDIYGELVNAFYETVRYEKDLSPDDLVWVRRLADFVCGVWREPDAGIWEVRGGERHFTYSKLMCWVALDRAIRLAERHPFGAPLQTWRTERAALRDAILTRGYDAELGSFVQAFGERTLDATGLLVPLLEFLPPQDPRVQGTIDATLRTLMQGGLVRRYGPATNDGLPGSEGAFVLCSFWLVDALSVSGRIEEAEALLETLVERASPLGLMAEEIDPDSGKFLGNYPQAYSHVGLINSVLYLGKAKERRSGPELVGLAGEGGLGG